MSFENAEQQIGKRITASTSLNLLDLVALDRGIGGTGGSTEATAPAIKPKPQEPPSEDQFEPKRRGIGGTG